MHVLNQGRERERESERESEGDGGDGGREIEREIERLRESKTETNESRDPYPYAWSLALPEPRPQQPDKGDTDKFLAPWKPETDSYPLGLAAGAGARGGPKTGHKDKDHGSELSSDLARKTGCGRRCQG